MRRVAVINVVGLTASLINEENAPFLRKWSASKSVKSIRPSVPAVTTTAQMNYFTGQYPKIHGVVGNGWKFKEEGEVKLWRQSNQLPLAPKIWDVLKADVPGFTCANTFGWYNMYSTVDYAITPRPQYAADGVKHPDIYTQPQVLRNRLIKDLGEFPLFDFWGPKAGLPSSRWIAQAAQKVEDWYKPTLQLIYLPHLDYEFQRVGPNHPRALKTVNEIDLLLSELIPYLEKAGLQVIVLSEYGIQPVQYPVHLNRLFREKNWLDLRLERGGEYLEPGNCKVFALADHQIAHIYIRDQENIKEVKSLVAGQKGVAKVLDKVDQAHLNLNHDRSGDLVVIAENDAWFTYYWWLDDLKAPDFARCVDIHKKPGYDPVELFINPEFRFPIWELGKRLIKKKLGFRYLMDVIPLKAELVKGSHGSPFCSDTYWPLCVGSFEKNNDEVIEPIDVFELIKQAVLA